MEKLKVGDRLYNKSESRIGKNVYYTFATVERLTKTQAILSNGKKLVNTGQIGYFDRDVFNFREVSDRWKTWTFETPEILEEARKERERQIVNRWFDGKKFTDEEKRIVYLKFKELGILNEPKKQTN